MTVGVYTLKAIRDWSLSPVSIWLGIGVGYTQYILLNTYRNDNVVITSKRCHFGVITLKWRRFDVITTSLLCHVSAGIIVDGSYLRKWKHVFDHHTGNWELSWCQLFHHLWQRMLWLRQPTVPLVTTKLASWRLLVFNPRLGSKSAWNKGNLDKALLRTADSEVHIIHISRVIITYTLESLSSLT